MNKEMDCDGIIIKEEVDHNVVINSENGDHIFMKEEPYNTEIVMKTEVDPDNIEIYKKYCFNNSNIIDPVVHEDFNSKQETNNFNVKEEYSGDFDVNNDICIKEEELHFSKYENSESILCNSADESSATQDESLYDGSSVEKVYDNAHQREWKVCEGNFTTRNKQSEWQETENQSSGKYQTKVGNHKNYQNVLNRPLSKNVCKHKEKIIFKCSNCNYSTSYRGNLKSHMRTHTDEKPFKCSDCDFNALHKSIFIRHNRIHTGKKPFKCSECDFSASQKSNLDNHNTGDIMASMEGDVVVDNVDEITKNILLFKDKMVLKESIYTLSDEEKNILNTILLKIKNEYQSKNNTITENIRDTEEDKIYQALYELLKDLPVVCDHNKDFDYVKEIEDKIKNNSLDINNIKLINSILINAEKNIHLLPLYTSFVRGNFYKFIKNKGMKDHEIIIKCNISKRQLYSYLSFYNLIIKYKSLLRINLSFTLITKNASLIIKFIESSNEFKEFFKNSRPF